MSKEGAPLSTKGTPTRIVALVQSELTVTSRERLKSAPYLRLKTAKGLQSVKYSLLQYPHEEKNGKKSKFFSRFFFNFFCLR